jgi:hypothetical protein
MASLNQVSHLIQVGTAEVNSLAQVSIDFVVLSDLNPTMIYPLLSHYITILSLSINLWMFVRALMPPSHSV